MIEIAYNQNQNHRLSRWFICSSKFRFFSEKLHCNAANIIEKEEGYIDVLINNAGISGGFLKPEDVTAEDMKKVYETNVFGIVGVTNAFIPLLRKSDNPVIVNVSSGLGSFGTVTDSTKEEKKENLDCELTPNDTILSEYYKKQE